MAIPTQQLIVSVSERLRRSGRVTRVFDAQDSGCVSYAWEDEEGEWLVKHAVEERAWAGLERAAALHAEVTHEALLSPVRRLVSPDGSPALVYPWCRGENLYDYTRFDAHARQHDPRSPHLRFRRMPGARVLDALDAIYDAHVAIERAGWVAVDLYDGCVLYEFSAHTLHLIDLDEYRRGAFVLEADRLPGSRRFMAPEEFVRGSRIDARTNVFALARFAQVFLADGAFDRAGWPMGEATWEVVEAATREDVSTRFASVAEFVGAWREATRHANGVADPEGSAGSHSRDRDDHDGDVVAGASVERGAFDGARERVRVVGVE